VHAIVSGLRTNLRGGGRVALFLPVRESDFRFSFADLIVLALFSLLAGLAADVAVAGSAGSPVLRALPDALFPIPLIVFAGGVAAAASGRRELRGVLPAILLAAGILPELAAGIAAFAAEYINRLPESLLYRTRVHGFFAWWGIAGTVAALRLGGRRRVATAGVCVVLVFIPLWFFPRGELWSLPEREASVQDSPATEEALYLQPEILDRELAALLPGRKGITDLYFVGFGGESEEDVFRNEVETSRALFDLRFGTAGRSAALVNSPRTLRSLPIASATSLARTLRRVGRVMDRDEDVLFLYLTSHGSEDHRLGVSFPPLELDDVDPAGLRRMLDDAGIRWRVIAVSACYSGGFIEPLKDDSTLVVTASDGNHSSFGCGTGSDFTWFGKAFLDEELRRTHSFTAAFAAARKSIQEREKAEGEEPSNPQMYLGPAMREKLKGLEGRWRRRVDEERSQSRG
jgi:hypothetical protein